MNPEILTLLGVGVALAGLIVSGQRSLRHDIHDLRGRMSQLDGRMSQLESRMSRLEGLFEGHLGAAHHQSKA